MSLLIFDKTGSSSQAFADVRVRRALSIAIDREQLVDELHPGDVPAWNALPSDSEGFTHDLDAQYAHSVSTAKSLLAQAGYPNGFSFTFIANEQSHTDALAIQKQLAAVGVTMEVKMAESTEEAFAAVATTPLGFLPVNWANPAGVMRGMIFGFANMQGGTNEALSAATGAVASDPSPETLTELNTRLVDDGWIIPVYEVLTTQGYNKQKLQKVEFAGTVEYPLISAYKRVS